MLTHRYLTRFAWLSVAAAVFTIGLKATAYIFTGSVGLLSDALESGVNLVAAVLALVVLNIAAQPPDEEHTFGHTKAEYFSSGVEGSLILVAGITIATAAIERLVHPSPLEQTTVGLTLSLVASLINFAVARILLRAGQQYRSITLTANSRHLMTDVWTSVGVLAGVLAVTWTGWYWLDPVLALAVAAQIAFSAFKLVRQSVAGLMDASLPESELAAILQILTRFQQTHGIQYHALRTRQSGAQRFVSLHIQTPGAWSVQRGHSLLEEIEQAIRHQLSPVSILIHLEPIEDPRSWQDIDLVRPGDETIPP
ncbi:MAG: cation diffusion facilitator family transporter [Candidatus Promineifilaceae bacterium]